MLSAKPALERFIALIALTAATAPLLGLLGTVTGMINTFNTITVFGTGDPRMLSGGISKRSLPQIWSCGRSSCPYLPRLCHA